MKAIVSINKDVLMDIKETDFNSARNIVRNLQATIADAIQNSIVLPDNATNGDMIMVMFGCTVIEISNGKVYVEHIYFPFDEKWWNAPYSLKKEK